jgi:hypothetical protein
MRRRQPDVALRTCLHIPANALRNPDEICH